MIDQTAGQKQLLDWLNDAHMMEEEIVQVLKSHLGDVKDSLRAQTLIEENIKQTESHSQRIKTRIEELGGSTSKAKEVTGSIIGKLLGPSTEMYRDKALKNSLLEYATEHFEMACYDSIKAAAEELEDIDTVTLVEKIFDEEKSMAEQIAISIPIQTKEFISDLK